MTGSFDQMRRRCLSITAAITPPVPFDVRALCARVAADRARPIHLLSAAMPAGSPCGLWIATDTADYLFYEESTSPVHHEHIILHELGHILCGHQGIVASGPDAGARYSTIEETEAELVASILRGQHDLGRCADPSAPEGDGPVRRLWSCLVDDD
jgi:Zn-dependent peptidase ImmA (M78 family)